MLLRYLLALSLLIFSSAVFAGSVDFNMSNHAAQFEAGYSPNGTANMQSGFTYNDQGSMLVDTALLANGGSDQESASGFAGGAGVKAIAGKIHQAGLSSYVSCIALGGQLAYTFPAAPSLALVGDVFASFKITSYGNTDRFNQFSISLQMGPPHAKFFIGYREITFDIIGTGGVLFDQGGYTGIMFSF